ncbi:uncharacterized protein LOC141826944 [Curcuma longa]|uniref:uncharacterized protein LOC141826944 n=1 Tax=Curcuma longa TaxID=136217 RepID=UPI003D9F5911
MRYGVNTEGKKNFSETPYKNQQRKVEKITENSLILNVKSLLLTGILEGLPVNYIKGKARLHGIISNLGYRCGCSSCNYNNVLSALEFEKHADMTSKNQNNYIFLECGITIYQLVKILKDRHIQLGSLHKVLMEFQIQPSIEHFEKWKGSFSVDINQNEISKDVDETEPNDLKIQITDDSVLQMKIVTVDEASVCWEKNLKLTKIFFWVRFLNFSVSIRVIIIKEETFCLSNVNSENRALGQEAGSDTKSALFLDNMKSSTSFSRHVEECYPSVASSVTLSSKPFGSSIEFDSHALPNITGIPESKQIEECHPSLASSVTLSSKPFGSSIELNSHALSNITGIPESRKVEERYPSLASNVSSKPFGSSIVCNSHASPRKHKVTSQSGSKKRDNSLHRLIFDENGLQDGSKLNYCVKGKTIKTGRKEGNCIICDCCHKKMSPSQFEAHAGFHKRRQPYRNIYTSDGITLHDLSSALFNGQKLIASSNKLLCATCRTGGNLVCRDGCTKNFHPDCETYASSEGKKLPEYTPPKKGKRSKRRRAELHPDCETYASSEGKKLPEYTPPKKGKRSKRRPIDQTIRDSIGPPDRAVRQRVTSMDGGDGENLVRRENESTPVAAQYTPTSILSDEKSLLSTGLLEGLPFSYKYNGVEAQGFIEGFGFRFSCSPLDRPKIVSALKSSKNAGLSIGPPDRAVRQRVTSMDGGDGENLIRRENESTPVAAQYTPTSILSDEQSLLSTGLLEGLPFSYKYNGVEAQGFIEGFGFRFSCSPLDRPKIVSALKSSKNAGGISNNVFLDSGVTLYTIVNRLKGTHLGSLDEVIKEVIHCPPNMEQFQKWKALFAPNGHVGIIASIADETSIEEQVSGLVKEIDDITLKSAEDSPCCSNLTKLQRPDESFLNRCDLDNHFLSKKQGVEYGVDLVSDNEAQKHHKVMRYGVNTEGKKNFSETPYKNQQRKVEKITENSLILNVKSLLLTGILEGLPVNYIKGKARLHGIISNLGYRCGCSSCNYNNVLSALEFEKHADMTSKNQNNYIFLECGITIYQLVKILKDRHIQLGSLHKVLMEFQIQPSIEHFEKWKGNSGSFSVDINQNEISKDVDETEPNDLKIQITDDSVLQALGREAGSDTKSALFLNNMKSSMSFSRHVEECYPSVASSVTLSSKPFGSSIEFDSHALPNITGIPESKQIEECHPSLASSVTLSSKPFGSSIELNSHALSNITGIPESRKVEERYPSLASNVSSKPFGSSIVCNSHASPRKHKVTSQSGSKKRDNSLHRLIFDENGLQDGSKLNYCVKGQTIKTGRKEGNCIICDCCHKKMSPSQFEAHAGFHKRRQPYRNIYTSDGITLHDLSSALFNGQKLIASSNKLLCATCRTGGNLVCCDGCTKNFHPACLELQIVPGGECYCPHCMDLRFRPHAINGRSRLRLITETDEFLCCTLCKDGSFILDVFSPKTIIFCTQCEREYHIGCLKDHGVCDLKEVPLDCTWFCSVECESIHSSLRNLVDDGEKYFPDWLCSSLKTSGCDLSDALEAGIYWQLLSGNYVSDKLKLDKTIEVFKEVYYPIISGGNDFLTSMVYGEDAAGKLLGGVYCVIIAVKSVIISAAIFRVFGRHVAEIPLVATCEKYRGKDYFLFSLVEQILSSLEVECIIVPTTKDMLSLWTDKLGFSEMSEEKLKAYLMEYPLMMFESTTILEKLIVREAIVPSQQEAMSTEEHAPEEAQLEVSSQLEEATSARGGHGPEEMEIDEVCPMEEETTSAEGDHVPKEIVMCEVDAMELILPSQQEATSAAGGHATKEVEVQMAELNQQDQATTAQGDHAPQGIEIHEVDTLELIVPGQVEATSADRRHASEEIEVQVVYPEEARVSSQQESTSAAGGHATKDVEVQMAELNQQDQATTAQGDHAPQEIEIHEVDTLELIVPGQLEATSADRWQAPKDIEMQVVYPEEARVSSQLEATSAAAGHATKEVEVQMAEPNQQDQVTTAQGDHAPQGIELHEVDTLELIVPGQLEATSADRWHAPEDIEVQLVYPEEVRVSSQQEATSAAGGHATIEVEVQMAELNQQDQATTAQEDHAPQGIEIHELDASGLIVPGQLEATSAARRHAPEEIEVQVVYPEVARVSSQQEATSAAGHATKEVEVQMAELNQQDQATTAQGDHAPQEIEIHEVDTLELIVPGQLEATSADRWQAPKDIEMQVVYPEEARVSSQQEATSAAGGHATKEVEVQMAELNQQDQATTAQGDHAPQGIEIHEVDTLELVVPGQLAATSAARRHAPEEIEVQVVYPEVARVSSQHESIVPNHQEAASVGRHEPEEMMMAQELNPKDPIVPSQQEAMSAEAQKLELIMPSQQEATSAKIKAEQVYRRRGRSTKEIKVDKVYQRRLWTKWRGASAPDS